MKQQDLPMAVCGLDCNQCDIMLAKEDPHIRQEIMDWLRDERGVSAEPEDIRCGGCREDREGCWSADCWIYACAVEDHEVNDCSECPGFPCYRLRAWSQGSPRYQQAFERLVEQNST